MTAARPQGNIRLGAPDGRVVDALDDPSATGHEIRQALQPQLTSVYTAFNEMYDGPECSTRDS